MFYELFGTEARTESHGVVADLCPYCCVVCMFEVRDHFRVGHLDGATPGRGTFIARARLCRGCDRDLSFDETKYAGVVPMAEAAFVPVAALLPRTNPRLVHRLAELDRIEAMTRSASYRGQGADPPFLECMRILRWLSSADVNEATVHRVASWSGLNADERLDLLLDLRTAADMLQRELGAAGDE